MKKLTIIALIAIGASACKSGPFTGRIVEKEYIAGHMCHSEGYAQVQEASLFPSIIVPHVATPPPHHHKWVPATVTVWVGNRNGVREFDVDSGSYNSWLVGSKVTFR